MKTLEETFLEEYKDEIRLRAENNYGDFRNREELEENIILAIDEIVEEMKESLKQGEKTREVIDEILDGYEF